MDGDRFDDLSRTLAAGISRRGAVKGIAAGLLGALGPRTAAGAQVSQAFCGNVVCASNPGICKQGCVCCVFANGNSRCMPPNKCNGVITSPTTTTTTTSPPLVCVPLSSRPCYTGPAGTLNVGICTGGIETCLNDGSAYGPCTGQVTPALEVCDGLDNDCDGVTDDGPLCPIGQFCDDGQCACLTGTHLCGDVCVSNLSPMSCGASCIPCPPVHNGLPFCDGTTCGAACDVGFADCDGVLATGCETNTDGDAFNCGACGHICPPANGTPDCVSGNCIIFCDFGFMNCDGDPANGCEVDTLNDELNCGSCGNVCDPDTEVCGNGTCVLN